MSNQTKTTGEDGPLLAEGVKKIAPGDIVQIKGNVGPKLTVIGKDPERADHVECVYWDTSREDCDRFESIFVHRDSLAVFDTPGPRASRRPLKVPQATLEAAIRSGRSTLSYHGHTPHQHILDCFNTVVKELLEHVDVPGVPF
jgi:hypothetical protein